VVHAISISYLQQRTTHSYPHSFIHLFNLSFFSPPLYRSRTIPSEFSRYCD